MCLDIVLWAFVSCGSTAQWLFSLLIVVRRVGLHLSSGFGRRHDVYRSFFVVTILVFEDLL